MINLNNILVIETHSKSWAIDSWAKFLALAIAVKKIKKIVSETHEKWLQIGAISESQGLPIYYSWTFVQQTACSAQVRHEWTSQHWNARINKQWHFHYDGLNPNCWQQTVWPDWAIYWTLGKFLKPLATIYLPKSPTFLVNFCKGVKIYHFSSELIEWLNIDYSTDISVKMNDLDIDLILSVRYLSGWIPSPPDEPGFKRGLDTSFNTNIC